MGILRNICNGNTSKHLQWNFLLRTAERRLYSRPFSLGFEVNVLYYRSLVEPVPEIWDDEPLIVLIISFVITISTRDGG